MTASAAPVRYPTEPTRRGPPSRNGFVAAYEPLATIALPCEVDVAGRGFKDPVIVGLPDTAVKESLERIHSALGNCGYEPPRTRVTVNLAPADLRKEGPAFDLPIALGMIFANGLGTTERAGQYLIAGELALDVRRSWAE